MMDKRYGEMSAAELEKELDELLDKLEDVELLRASVLGQTGNHVSGGYVKRFEQEQGEINDEIAAVKAAIALKKS